MGEAIINSLPKSNKGRMKRKQHPQYFERKAVFCVDAEYSRHLSWQRNNVPTRNCPGNGLCRADAWYRHTADFGAVVKNGIPKELFFKYFVSNEVLVCFPASYTVKAGVVNQDLACPGVRVVI